MHTSRFTRTASFRGFASLLGGAILVTLVTAAPATASMASADDAAAPPKRGDNLLGGPKVEDGAGKDDRTFGKDGKEGKGGKPGQQGARRPMAQVRLWMETMKSMDLSPEQREKVDAVVARFQTARNEFESANGEARKALEQKVKENGPETAEGKEARQAMKALAEKAPKPEAYQAEAFALLTPDQQEAFKKRLAEREAAMQERRKGEQAGPDGKRPPRGGQQPGAGGPPSGRGGDQGGNQGGNQGGAGRGADQGQGRGKGRPSKDGTPPSKPPQGDDPMR